MTNRNHLTIALLGCFALLAGAVPAAHAGGVYQLNFQVCGPTPALPADITVNLYEGSTPDPGKLRGTSSETFVSNGNIPAHACDAVACLTDTRTDGPVCGLGALQVDFQINGFDKGKLKTESYFEVVINGVATGLQLHTSCSQPIPFQQPIVIGDQTWTIVGGAGSCLPGAPGCPDGSKLYEVNGEYRVDVCGCTAPFAVTLNLYKSDTDLKGTSTAMWDGMNLTNIVCDNVACLESAVLEGCELVIQFTTFGQKDNGEYEADSAWEMLLDGCGGGKTAKIHTSCSQPFYIGLPHEAGNGTFTFTDGCGACIVNVPVSVEDSSWGHVKGLYR